MTDHEEIAVIVSEHRCEGCGEKVTSASPCLRIPQLEVSSPTSASKFTNLARLPLNGLSGEQLVFHSFSCLRAWAVANPTIKALFTDWLIDERRFLFVVKGVREWLSVAQVEALFAERVTHVYAAGRVREADGVERTYTDDERTWVDGLDSTAEMLTA